jgi:predicted TIM-barrel fold metal-dependent hydrolase
VGIPIEKVVKEMLALPLKDQVKEKWLYKNAARLFDLRS